MPPTLLDQSTEAAPAFRDDTAMLAIIFCMLQLADGLVVMCVTLVVYLVILVLWVLFRWT